MNGCSLGEPWCDVKGLAETGRSKGGLVEALEKDLNQFLTRSNKKTLRDDDKLEEGLRRVARQTANNEIGKKPEVTVVVSRMR